MRDALLILSTATKDKPLRSQAKEQGDIQRTQIYLDEQLLLDKLLGANILGIYTHPGPALLCLHLTRLVTSYRREDCFFCTYPFIPLYLFWAFSLSSRVSVRPKGLLFE